MNYALCGKFITLRPVYPDDYELLAEWASNLDQLGLWTSDRLILSHEEAVERTIYRLRDVELVRFMIASNGKESDVCGTVYAYDHHPQDGYCFVTVLVTPENVGKGFGADAAIMTVDYLFSNFSWLHKIYSDVYAYNDHSLRMNRKAGLNEEGHFREHRFYAGKRWDLYRFALYRSEWCERRNHYFRYDAGEIVNC
jgi:RimJ/RimL family protein N-acetyltransferase